MHRHAADLIDFNYRYAPNDWCHDVVLAVRCIRSFCERKINSHPNNSSHPFFQPNGKSIMVMPMNVKEFLLRSVGHFSAKFRPKLWISCFRPKCQISRFRSFFVQNEFLVSLGSCQCECRESSVHSHYINWYYRCQPRDVNDVHLCKFSAFSLFSLLRPINNSRRNVSQNI